MAWPAAAFAAADVFKARAETRTQVPPWRGSAGAAQNDGPATPRRIILRAAPPRRQARPRARRPCTKKAQRKHARHAHLNEAQAPWRMRRELSVSRREGMPFGQPLGRPGLTHHVPRPWARPKGRTPTDQGGAAQTRPTCAHPRSPKAPRRMRRKHGQHAHILAARRPHGACGANYPPRGANACLSANHQGGRASRARRSACLARADRAPTCPTAPALFSHTPSHSPARRMHRLPPPMGARQVHIRGTGRDADRPGVTGCAVPSLPPHLSLGVRQSKYRANVTENRPANLSSVATSPLPTSYAYSAHGTLKHARAQRTGALCSCNVPRAHPPRKSPYAFCRAAVTHALRERITAVPGRNIRPDVTLQTETGSGNQETAREWQRRRFWSCGAAN